MRFEWDEVKSRKNLRKHGISFALASEAFSDPFCLIIPDAEVEGEERFWTIGRIEWMTIVVVVRTTRNLHGEEIVRIISARRATPRERRIYEEIDE